MPSPTRFHAEQFTATQFYTAEQKAKFANQFARFVERDFPRSAFTKSFYNILNGTFGHIAHYDIHGFWNEFFTTPEDKRRFIEQSLRCGGVGNPAYCFSDVELELREWLLVEGTAARFGLTA